MPHPQRPTPPAPYVRHVLLTPAERWRCDWCDRGRGTVVAHAELMGMVTAYDVALDTGGAARRAMPADIRRIPDLQLVAAP